jgi:hypothetical protein
MRNVFLIRLSAIAISLVLSALFISGSISNSSLLLPVISHNQSSEQQLNNGSTFLSYDDATSISAKANYAVSKNMLGVGAWDISYDRNDVLINAIKSIIG